MNCTDFAKGIAAGMVLGGTVVFILTRHGKKKCGVLGTALKTTGCIIDSVSKAMNL